MLRSLARNYRLLLDEGYHLLMERYRARSAVLGEEVLISTDDADEIPRILVSGRVVAIGDGLELKLADRVAPVTKGSTAGGILLAKGMNLFLREGSKINSCIGAAGVSAVPMSARVVQQFVSTETKGRVKPLMAAMGPDVAGIVGSAVTAGVFLALLR